MSILISPPQRTKTPFHQWRARILAFLLIAFALLIVGRLVQLQVVEHDRFLKSAQVMQEQMIELMPQRGAIYDRSGMLLAFDVRAVSIAVDSFNMTKPETIIAILASELGLAGEVLRDLIYRPSYFTWVKRQIDPSTAELIQQQAEKEQAYGLIFLDTWKRCYPQESLASNIIGFVGTDGHGLEGVELAFDEVLTGTPTYVYVVQGADHRTYHTAVVEQGSPGQDLHLTIDGRLQFICEEEIKYGVEKFRANDGFVVLLDPQTCTILAMAQLQRYNLNSFAESTPYQRKNLAVNFLFEPGSVFKAFTGLAALDYGAVSPGDSFNGNDGIRVSNHIMHNSGNESFGTVTFAEIIEQSINTGMIRVAQRLGEERLYHSLIGFGFGQQTGIALPGEEVGILRDVEEWSKLALAATSIGQSVAVTGIQLARATAAIANGGLLLEPQIIKQIGESEKDDSVLVHRIGAAESCTIMTRLLRQAVESGTGTPAAVSGFAVAGKTGTAQKATPGQGYAAGKYTSLFVGYLPAQKPQYLALVVLDEVKTLPVWGGYTAGQIFHNITSRVVNAEHLSPVAAY